MKNWMEANGQTVIQCLLIVLLVVVILFVIRLIALLGKFVKMGTKLNNSMDIVNDYLDDMKMPVRALVNVSMSLEALRAASETSLRSFFDSITATCNKIIEQLKKIIDTINKKKETEEVTVRAEESLPEETAAEPAKAEEK